jgi:D-alanyl-D-alanine carboxypeptidase (penicillin-binding protein 5/6)
MRQVAELDGWWKFLRVGIVAAAAAGLLLLHGAPAAASTHRKHHHVHSHAHHRRAPMVPYKGALLEDAESGKVLYADNPDMEWPPASMAKMMLLLVAEDQIKAGRVHLDDPVRISERSAHTMGSRIVLVEGKIYPLRELMKAALIKSANNAAVAIAEKIGGSVEATVRMMNARAKALGMTHTEYRTVDGLPPRPAHDVDHTSARDLATVARQLIYHTDLLKWSSLEQASFDGGECMLHNTNHLIGHFEGCDGLKTGFTYQAGFNLTATAKRGDLRLIAVVLGAPSNPQRFAQAAKLLEWGFNHYTAVSLFRRGQPLPMQVQVKVQAGAGDFIQPVAASELRVVVPKGEVESLKVDFSVPKTVTGPVRKGEPLGKIIARDGAGVVDSVAAVSPVSVNLPQQANDGWNPPGAAAYNQEYPRFQESQ